MKKIALLLSMILLCICLTACAKQNEAKVSAYDLQKTMLDSDSSLPDMTTVNSNASDADTLFSYLSDMNYDKVDSYFLAYSSEGLADEVAVIILKDSSDADEAEESLKKHVQGRVSLYQSYQPDQVARAERALVFTEGNYAVLIISDNQKDIKDAFESEMNK